MGWHVDLRAGLAQLLDDDGIATWSPTGVVSMTASPPPVYDTAIPDPAPDVALAIASYDTGEDEPGQAESLVSVQLRSRSTTDPRTGENLIGSAVEALLGRYPVTLPSGVQVLTIVQASSSPLGRDQSGRWEYVCNINIRAYRPTTYRR